MSKHELYCLDAVLCLWCQNNSPSAGVEVYCNVLTHKDLKNNAEVNMIRGSSDLSEEHLD